MSTLFSFCSLAFSSRNASLHDVGLLLSFQLFSNLQAVWDFLVTLQPAFLQFFLMEVTLKPFSLKLTGFSCIQDVQCPEILDELLFGFAFINWLIKELRWQSCRGQIKFFVWFLSLCSSLSCWWLLPLFSLSCWWLCHSLPSCLLYFSTQAGVWCTPGTSKELAHLYRGIEVGVFLAPMRCQDVSDVNLNLISVSHCCACCVFVLLGCDSLYYTFGQGSVLSWQFLAVVFNVMSSLHDFCISKILSILLWVFVIMPKSAVNSCAPLHPQGVCIIVTFITPDVFASLKCLLSFKSLLTYRGGEEGGDF